MIDIGILVGLAEFDIDIYLKIMEKMIIFEGNNVIESLFDRIEIE